MNVFADFHHSDLMHGLYRLFEGRLGGNLYRPIGLDWHRHGYWRYYEAEPTIRQFLDIATGHRRPADGTHALNEVSDVVDGVYYVYDRANLDMHKAITLDTFNRMDIDIVIASIPQHWHTFAKLIADHKPNAKLICQLGNAWHIDPSVCRNVLASIAPVPVPDGVNAVFYHQEFDLNIFRYEPPVPGSRKIAAFMNVLGEGGRSVDFDRLRAMLPGFDFRSYGAQNEHGVLGTHQEIAREMHESLFVWHVKPGGDGFGHVLHNAFACGRPVITRTGHYAGKLGGELMTDGVTCIDLGTQGPDETAYLVQAIAGDPAWHERLCQSARARFDAVVDFDAEEVRIREFLERLI